MGSVTFVSLGRDAEIYPTLSANVTKLSPYFRGKWPRTGENPRTQRVGRIRLRATARFSARLVRFSHASVLIVLMETKKAVGVLVCWMSGVLRSQLIFQLNCRRRHVDTSVNFEQLLEAFELFPLIRLSQQPNKRNIRFRQCLFSSCIYLFFHGPLIASH